VLETVQANEAEVSFIEDKATQIGIEGSADNKEALQKQVKQVKDKAQKLKEDAEKLSQYYGNMLAQRSSFNEEIVKAIDFLKQKEHCIPSHEQLPMEEDYINAEQKKLQDLANEIYRTLGPVEEMLDEQKKGYEENDEGIPLDIRDQMDNYEQLRDNVKV
jgi:hypothetical protein